MQRSFISQLRRSKFLRYGLPFICSLVLGSYGLTEFTSIVVNKREEKNRMLTAEEMLSFQKKPGKVDLEEEYRKTMEELDIEHWENKRGPRPWEQQQQTDINSR